MLKVDRYVSSGSEYNFADKLQLPNNPSSVFSLNHSNVMSFPVGSFGALIPIGVFETVPNDQFEIRVASLLRVLPQVVPLYSGVKLFIYATYARYGDLMNYAQVYMTKGYNGKRVLKKSVLTSTLIPAMADPNATVKSDDLLHYLYHLPIGAKYADFDGKLEALTYMHYVKQWRDYFCNKNFYTEDSEVFPDDDADFRLNSDGELISSSDGSMPSSLPQDSRLFLYRDHADDRFTSSMPSPQRGDPAKLHLSLDFEDLPVLIDDPNGKKPVSLTYSGSVDPVMQQSRVSIGKFGSDVDYFTYGINSSSGTLSMWPQSISSTSRGGQLLVNLSEIVDTGIGLNDLRNLAINQTELEKMARTDGSYEEFGLTFFGRPSKIAVDYRPTLIGATYQPVIFTEVVQTSASTESSSLGTYGGHGISSDNGYIGSVNCDDYGEILVTACIVPDTLYSQGIDKMFTRLYQADEFLPDRAKLGAQPVYNKEIYWQGTDDDDDLFAYQDIFDELRYLPSRVHGKLADPTALSFFPYTQSRYFESLPTYSQSFATMKDNVRYDFLAAPIEVPFTAEFGFQIRCVRNLPYKAIPAAII